MRETPEDLLFRLSARILPAARAGAVVDKGGRVGKCAA
jgi:hypothetical protein